MVDKANINVVQIEVSPRDNSIPVDSFLKILTNAVAILRTIDVETSESHRQTVRWRIEKASMNSPLSLSIMGVADNPARVGQIAGLYLDGLRELDSDQGAIPRHFTEGSLAKAKQIVSALNDGIQQVKFSNFNREVIPTQRVAAAVDALMAGAGLSAYGTLDGILETLTNRSGPQTFIRDRLTGHQVQCSFEAKYIPELGAAWTKRVRVYGKIRYGKTGRPRSITVDGGIHVFPDRSEFPQAKDLEGIDITGGVESSEYVSRLRNE
jgi:hypothetical protein